MEKGKKMVEITKFLIKELRERTGSGIMNCKEALIESNGDLDLSIEYLRKKGLSSSRKISNISNEGLIALKSDRSYGTIIELNSETDFVSKNKQFQGLLKEILNLAFSKRISSLENLKLSSVENYQNQKVIEKVQFLSSIIGENLCLNRIGSLSIEKNQGLISYYVHNQIEENMGRIGVLVSLESKADPIELENLGKKIAMHIAASRPEYVKISDINKEEIERERRIFEEQAKLNNVQENIIDNVINGKLSKYYESVVLEEQIYVIDGKSRVSDVLRSFSNDMNAQTKVKDFLCFVLGQNKEKK